MKILKLKMYQILKLKFSIFVFFFSWNVMFFGSKNFGSKVNSLLGFKNSLFNKNYDVSERWGMTKNTLR